MVCQKHNRLLIIALLIFLILGKEAHSQENLVKRLYVPISGNATLVRENNTDNLLINNYLSSNILEINFGGSIDYQSYSPFGTTTDRNIPSDRQFTSHRKLENLSIYHAGARFYSPTVGQFIQPDKKEGPNRYAYVNNNPVEFVDMDGKSATSVIVGRIKEWLKRKLIAKAPSFVENYSRYEHAPLPDAVNPQEIMDRVNGRISLRGEGPINSENSIVQTGNTFNTRFDPYVAGGIDDYRSDSAIARGISDSTQDSLKPIGIAPRGVFLDSRIHAENLFDQDLAIVQTTVDTIYNNSGISFSNKFASVFGSDRLAKIYRRDVGKARGRSSGWKGGLCELGICARWGPMTTDVFNDLFRSGSVASDLHWGARYRETGLTDSHVLTLVHLPNGTPLAADTYWNRYTVPLNDYFQRDFRRLDITSASSY